MRYGVAIGLGLILAAAGWAQDAKDPKKEPAGGDKIGKLKAPDLVRKIVAELQKKKGCGIKEISNMIRGQQKVESTFEGIQRKEFAAVKGQAEIYVRGKEMLVNVGGRFDPPDKLEPQDGAAADSFKNPQLLLTDAGKIANGASYANDEVVDGKDCRVIDMLADEGHLRQLLKEFADQLSAQADRRAQGGGGGGGGLGGFGGRGGMMRLNEGSFDMKTSVSTYKLWVSKEDLNVMRLEWYLTPKLKPNAIPKEFQARVGEFQMKVDVLFSKWDEDIPYDIPAVIKTKWGIVK